MGCLIDFHSIHVAGYTFFSSCEGWIVHPYKDGFLDCSGNVFPSLCTMLRFSKVVMWPVVDWWPYVHDGVFRYSLNLSPDVLANSPMYLPMFREHLKAPSPIFDHQSGTGHTYHIRQIQHCGEGKNCARTIKESISIIVKNPTLHRNIGKCNMPYDWNGILFNTPELKIKDWKELLQQHHVYTTSVVPSRASSTYKIVDNNIFLQF